MGGLSSIHIFLDFWNFFNFAKPLTNLLNPIQKNALHMFPRLHQQYDISRTMDLPKLLAINAYIVSS